MRLKTIIKILQLKWFLYKIMLLQKLPFPASFKKSKLSQMRLTVKGKRSDLQSQVIEELYGRHLYGLVFNTGNGKIINHFYDVSINQALGLGGGYNLDEIDILLSFLTPASVVYIAGTHVGTLVIPIAKKVKLVAGFEANPDSFALLNENIKLNEVDNVQPFNYALYDRDETLSFYKDKENSGGSKIQPKTGKEIFCNDRTEIIQVTGKRLDDICSENNLPAADMLIMDIEGAEYAAMQGAPKVLQQAKQLYIEFVPKHLEHVSAVSVEQFLAVISPYYNRMQIMQEMVKQKNIYYTIPQAKVKLDELYSKVISVDLIFSKE
jgi:FkbM family methyltransferase